jgi:hypothetical protein
MTPDPGGSVAEDLEQVAVDGARSVEVDEHVGSAPGQGLAESGEFAQLRRDAAAHHSYELDQRCFRGGPVGVAVGGDDAPIT